MLRNNKKIISAMIIAALAMPISTTTTVLADENTNQTTTTNTNHAVSVQKLYANVYDQENGQFLGRYLLDIETGYTDSPHRMFQFYSFPQIDGYGYISNPPSMIPVDWTNPSGITDMKVYVVKKSSEAYKKTYGIPDSNTNQNNHHTNHQSSNNSQASNNNQNSQSSASSSSKQSSDQDENSSEDQSQSSTKPKKSKKSATQTKSDQNKTKQKTSAWPTIVISGAVLIIAAVAIIWGINKTRKPHKVYKHQKK